jgi:GT2 family glycosyltransferase
MTTVTSVFSTWGTPISWAIAVTTSHDLTAAAISPPAPPEPRLSVVIVAYNEAESLQAGLPRLLPELGSNDEVIVANNASTDGTADVVRGISSSTIVVERASNDGFPAAANDGVAAASGDLILLLNPDTVVAPGFRDRIVRPWREGRFDAWMGLVTMERGSLINTSGGIVHFTGLAWAGQVGRPADEAPPEPREVPFVSGACLAIPRATWERIGAMPGDNFLYFDDVDISLRIRLQGGRVGIEPAARADHRYEFSKGLRKWRMLEKNRWATMIRCYPGPLLALLAPALVVTEVAMIAIAFHGGWGPQKLQAMGDVARRLPSLLSERREVQAQRAISSSAFAQSLTPDLDSPYLGRVGRSRIVRALLRAYWALVLAALRATD